MVYGTYNYSYWGESKPTNITGGPHIVWISKKKSDRGSVELKIEFAKP